MFSPISPGFLENQILRVWGRRHAGYVGEVDQKPGFELETILEIGNASGN